MVLDLFSQFFNMLLWPDLMPLNTERLEQFRYFTPGQKIIGKLDSFLIVILLCVVAETL